MCAKVRELSAKTSISARELSFWPNHADRLAATLGVELHGAGGGREQGVVAATSAVHAGVEVGAALTDQDLAGLDDLAAEPLHAQPLGGGVTTVTCAGSALLVCHY